MKKVGVYLFLIFFSFQNSLLAYSSNPKNFVAELVDEAGRRHPLLVDRHPPRDEVGLRDLVVAERYLLKDGDHEERVEEDAHERREGRHYLATGRARHKVAEAKGGHGRKRVPDRVRERVHVLLGRSACV